jgi:hypothetical protein
VKDHRDEVARILLRLQSRVIVLMRLVDRQDLAMTIQGDKAAQTFWRVLVGGQVRTLPFDAQRL